MREENKRFFTTVTAIVVIWFSCWLLIWSPNTRKVEAARQKINHLTQEIAACSAGNISLAEESIAEKEQQRKQAGQRLQELASQVHYEADTKKSGGLSHFRSQLNQKVLELRNRANRIGITMDESLGFPATIAANNFHEGYWVSLEIVSQVMTQLLELSGEERSLQEIGKIGHPSLNKSTPAAFVQEVPLEFTIQAKWAFIMKVVSSVSQPRQGKSGETNGNHFLKLSQLVLESIPSTTDGTTQAKFTLSALQINPQGQIRTAPDSVPSSKSPESITPIWERY